MSLLDSKCKSRNSVAQSRFTMVGSLVILAISLLVFLTARNAGMYPSVFADEWFYNLFSRLYDIKYAQRPSYLYFGIYSLTNQCGDGFLECARLINALFFLAAIPFIYSLARQYLSRRIALWVTAISVFSPINVYTAYFMPESMYYFGFYLFAWITLKGFSRKPIASVIFAGFALGAMTMVKVHAVFLLPGLWAVIALPLLSTPNYKNAVKVCGLVFISFIAFLSCRLGIGYLVVGKAGLDILGTDYTATATSASGMQQIRHLIPLTAYNLWGNILAVAVMFALPLAMLSNISIYFKNDEDRKRLELRALNIFTSTLLILLIVVTAIFFARVQGTSPYENIQRLSLRYYDFLFPLFYIIIGVEVNKDIDGSRTSKFKLLSIGVIALISAYAVATGMRGYLPGIADGPELRAFTYNPYVFSGLGVLGIICSIVSMFHLRTGAKLYIWFYLPLTILLSGHFTNKEMRLRLESDAYDEAGQFVQRYLGSDVAKLVIVAPELSSIFRAHFYMKSQKTAFITLPNNSRIDPHSISENKEWLLLMGSYDNPFDIKEMIRIPERTQPFNLSNFNVAPKESSLDSYTLVRIASSLTVNFLDESLSPQLRKVEGLAVKEQIGRWSTGKQLLLTFSKPLPEKFELTLDAFAFGPNIGEPISMEIGGKLYKFVLSGKPSTVKISIASDRRDENIKIEIPDPISPEDLGLSSDTRKLGVALRLITIREPLHTN
ncbi:glycosyltransferase family 39 protein [Rhodoferax sp. GW822-FHT02A01]|uniref:DUF7024 domain-containing protein n=1 Tax=Rhodoferax sp. GW822-FHT02A01 TaxID=3141537 RepID=UPI00315D4800